MLHPIESSPNLLPLTQDCEPEDGYHGCGEALTASRGTLRGKWGFIRYSLSPSLRSVKQDVCHVSLRMYTVDFIPLMSGAT